MPTTRPSTEAAFQRQVLQLAAMCGWRVYHTHDSRRSQPGFPDLVLAHPRRGVIFAELKTDTGTPTAAQSEWLDTLRAAGARVFLWRPADLDQVAAVLAGEAPA